MTSSWPRCGLYLTTRPLGDLVPAGRLIRFHDHGDPGPGVYLPLRWRLNRAEWQKRGATVTDADWARSLEPLPPEGFYRVRESFFCCPKHCRRFEADLLVQLGYDATARALLFVPEWTHAGLAIAATGTAIDAEQVARLAPLKVAEATPVPEGPVC